MSSSKRLVRGSLQGTWAVVNIGLQPQGEFATEKAGELEVGSQGAVARWPSAQAAAQGWKLQLRCSG